MLYLTAHTLFRFENGAHGDAIKQDYSHVSVWWNAILWLAEMISSSEISSGTAEAERSIWLWHSKLIATPAVRRPVCSIFSTIIWKVWKRHKNLRIKIEQQQWRVFLHCFKIFLWQDYHASALKCIYSEYKVDSITLSRGKFLWSLLQLEFYKGYGVDDLHSRVLSSLFNLSGVMVVAGWFRA